MILYAVPLMGVLALIFTYVKSAWVGKQEVGNERMAGIAKAISDGAMAFLRAEYKILAIFVVIVAIYCWCFLFGSSRIYWYARSYQS